jgi:hypothetical protein
MSVDKMSVDKMSVDKMLVDKMSVDKMSVDKISVDKMTVRKYWLTKSWWTKCHSTDFSLRDQNRRQGGERQDVGRGALLGRLGPDLAAHRLGHALAGPLLQNPDRIPGDLYHVLDFFLNTPTHSHKALYIYSHKILFHKSSL